MLDRPGVGYVSRFVRDLRTATNARHALHQAGATILFADDDILLSDAATRVKTWGMIPSWTWAG